MGYADILKEFQNMLLTQKASQSLRAAVSNTRNVEQGIYTYLSNRVEGFYKVFSRIFPKVQKAVTENNFRILVEEFSIQVTGYHGDLAAYSQGFPSYLGQHPNLKQLEWIEELGTLEWMVSQLEYHKPVLPLTPEKASSVDAITRNPTLTFKPFNYTVGNFWDVTQLEDADIAYSEEASFYLVWKNQDLQLVWCNNEELSFVLPLFQENSTQKKSPQEMQDFLGEDLFNVAIEQGWLVQAVDEN